jgi:proteasome accessory factor B
MSKLERLLNLTAVLLATDRPLTADELRQQVEGYPEATPSFRRAFERDKDDLRTLGIPLRVERVLAADPPLDGYRIPPDEYYLPDPGLGPDELAALHLASLTVRLVGMGEQEALWKLGGLGTNGPEENGLGNNGLVGESIAELPGDPALIPLFSAISERHPVQFRYRDEDRRVDPWRLAFQRGRWYLSGYDQLRSGERNYRIDRIDGAIVVDGDAEWSQDPKGKAGGRTLQAWEMGEDEPIAVKLRVDAAQAAMAGRQLGPDVLAEAQADGAVVFDVPVVNRDAFRSFVLGFLEHAEILEPVEIRADLRSWLESAVARSVNSR